MERWARARARKKQHASRSPCLCLSWRAHPLPKLGEAPEATALQDASGPQDCTLTNEAGSSNGRVSATAASFGCSSFGRRRRPANGASPQPLLCLTHTRPRSCSLSARSGFLRLRRMCVEIFQRRPFHRASVESGEEPPAYPEYSSQSRVLPCTGMRRKVGTSTFTRLLRQLARRRVSLGGRSLETY